LSKYDKLKASFDKSKLIEVLTHLLSWFALTLLLLGEALFKG